MKIEFAWEVIDAQTLRAKVLGGWLVRYHSPTGSVALTMVPDPKHVWTVVIPTGEVERARERLEKLEHNLQDPYIDQSIEAEMRAELDHLRRFIDHHGQE